VAKVRLWGGMILVGMGVFATIGWIGSLFWLFLQGIMMLAVN
jgi:hypothetical protein